MRPIDMKAAAALAASACIVAGCQNGPAPAMQYPGSSAEPAAASGSLADYKQAVARRISEVSGNRISQGRPQAMLHSVVVIRFTVDADGRLVTSHIERSNRVRANENAAMESLKAAAPFPRPPSHLLRRGRLELYESWLFNSDGRFQVRSIAEPQMDR